MTDFEPRDPWSSFSMEDTTAPTATVGSTPTASGRADLAARHSRAGADALARGELAVAERCLTEALAIDPGHADTLVQLGELKLLQHPTPEVARSYFAAALASDPSHAGARRHAEPTAVEAPDVAISSDTSDLAMAQYGIHEFLRHDNSVLSRHAVSLIESLRMSRRPHFSAYLGRVGMITLGLIALAASSLVVPGLIDYLARSLSGNTTGFSGDVSALVVVPLSVAAWCAVVLGYYVRVATTRFTLFNGRLQVSRGVIRRRVDTHDLWIVREITLSRTLVNRVTGDGALILWPALAPIVGQPHRPAKPLIVRGLARGEELDVIYQRLVNLKFLLRANPAVKGIIQ